MKILIVHNYYRIPGGEDTVVSNETALLKSHGHEVISYNRNNSEYFGYKGFGKLKKLAIPFVTIYNHRTFREVTEIITKEKIEAVCVHNTLNLVSPSVYYAAVKCNVPVFQTIHNYRLLCPAATFYRNGHICEDCVAKGLKCAIKHKCYRGSFLETLACVILLKIHRMTGIYSKINYICLAEFGKEKLLLLNKLGVGIDEKKVFVKPNFMPRRRLDSVMCFEYGQEGCSEAGREESSETFNKRQSEYACEKNTCRKKCNSESYFIYAGRLDALKGVDFLIKAWRKDMPKLVVCGTGPLENLFTDEKSSPGGNSCGNIDYRGFMDHDSLMELIAGAEALILPTRWYEGFPMTIVEAYSVGTPVIASNIGNAGSLVEEGVTGFHFEVDDETSLREAVEKTMATTKQTASEQTASKQDGLRKSTYKTYCEKYTDEKNYDVFMKILGG